jgi:hypothetical protein
MPRVLEAPHRQEGEGRWEAANCAYEETVAWRRHSSEPGWTLPRQLRARTGLASQVALEVLFENLADKWEEATAFESVVTRQAMHPAYQRIIGMGDEAVPLILRRLQREPRQWFWALTAITGEDPAGGTQTAEEAAEAWLDWGRARGLIID